MCGIKNASNQYIKIIKQNNYLKFLKQILGEAVSRLAAKVFEELRKTITNPLELSSNF